MNLSPTVLRSLLDASVDAVLWLDTDRRFAYVSPAFTRLTGHAPEDLMADPGLFGRLIHPTDQQTFRTHLDHFAAPEHERIDLRIIDKNGVTRWITHSCKPVFDPATGQLAGRISHNRDITERKTAELHLHDALAQGRLFNAALDRVAAFVCIRDSNFHFLYANRQTLEFFGCAIHRLLGAPDTHYFPPDAIRQLRELDRRALAGEDIAGEITIKQGEGTAHTFGVVESPLFADGEGSPVIGITCIATDITETRQLQDHLLESLVYQKKLSRQLEETQHQLLQSEKLASIGQLAAGVAHEINNPIGFINSNLGTLESYLHDLFVIIDACDTVQTAAQREHLAALKQAKDFDFLRSDAFQLMAESKDGLGRVARIVRNLKEFSSIDEAGWAAADLHASLDATLDFVPGDLKNNRVIHKNYGALPPVWCAPAQLNQVFLNLLMNACQAIPEQGEITISTGQQGTEVFVAIADTGVGIPEENLARIFDPFFTTRPVGAGTGLGLSLVHGIVKNHRGRVEVQSTPGKGSTFTVWLPVRPDGHALP